MLNFFGILLFVLIKISFSFKQDQEIVLVSVGGSCHFYNGLLGCKEQNYVCRSFGFLELCIRDLNNEGDICNKNKCKHCLAGFCLQSFKRDRSYLFISNYLNYQPKTSRFNYLKRLSRDEANRQLISNNIN